MSIRKEIRAWLRDQLVNQTQAEERVFVNRRAPIHEDAEYPLILIYSEPEDATVSNVSNYSYIRTYQVIVDIRARGESIDDSLDDIAEEIEAIMAFAEVSENVTSFDYLGAEPTADDEGDELLGSLRLKFFFKYIR